MKKSFRTGWTPQLANSDGQSVPLFILNRGSDHGRAIVEARIDGEAFWIGRQELGTPRRDYSGTVLAILKDFQALNTSQDQLPNSPAVLLSR